MKIRLIGLTGRREPPFSKANDENVVKAPKKPTKIIARIWELIESLFSAKAHISPNKRQPIMLTIAVRHGNSLAILFCIRPDKQ